MYQERREPCGTFGAICFLMTVVGVFLWRAPWSGSLWLDEALSVWTVRDSLGECWTRALSFQTQSPFFYCLMWCVRAISGSTNEVWMRLVSLMAALGSAYVVFEIARKLHMTRCAALCAVACMVGTDIFQVGSITARPHALATLCALWSVFAIISLVQQPTRRAAASCVAAVVLTCYVHYLFAAIALPHAFILWRRPAAWRVMRWPALIGGVACVPAACHMYVLSQRYAGFALATIPSAREFITDYMPLPLAVAGCMGLSLAYIWDGRARLDAATREAMQLLTPYIVLAPLPFLLGAIFGGAPIWLPRYWEWQAGPLAIVVVALASSVQGARVPRLALWVLATVVCLRGVTQVWHPEGWGEAGKMSREYSGPVLLFTGLMEAETAVTDMFAEFDRYIRAPLLVYGRERDIQVLKLTESDDALRPKFVAPALLIVARKQLGTRVSPDRFVAMAKGQGISVKALSRGDEMIQMYLLEPG